MTEIPANTLHVVTVRTCLSSIFDAIARDDDELVIALFFARPLSRGGALRSRRMFPQRKKGPQGGMFFYYFIFEFADDLVVVCVYG